MPKNKPSKKSTTPVAPVANDQHEQKTPDKQGNAEAGQGASPPLKTPEDRPSPHTPVLSFGSGSSSGAGLNNTVKQQIKVAIGLDASQSSLTSTESIIVADAGAQTNNDELSYNGIEKIVRNAHN